MAPSPLRSKSLHHGRSLSLPSASHPAVSQFDESLSKLRSSEVTCSSLSSMKGTVNGLRSLFRSIDDLLLLPHIQQIISEECADGFIRLLDACTTVRDLISVTKQDLRELLFSVRRKDVQGINKYLQSRRKAKKAIQKSLKNLRRCASASSERGSEEMSFLHMMKEAEFVAFSLMESLLSCILGAKVQESKSGWSLVSKLMHMKKVSVDGNEFNKVDSFLQRNQDNEVVNHLKEMDSSIQGVEEELESMFRQLIKTRVSLLNILNH